MQYFLQANQASANQASANQASANQPLEKLQWSYTELTHKTKQASDISIYVLPFLLWNAKTHVCHLTKVKVILYILMQ